jgi:tetratricopeptide (TPR) repeat protein
MLIGSVFAALAIFSCLGFFVWTIVPQLQGREYLKKAAVAYTPDVIIDDTFIFEPYTNAQGLIRYMLLGDLVQKFSSTPMSKPDPLFEKALSELEVYVIRFPYYYDYFVLMGKGYEAEALMKNDRSLEKTAERYYQKALAVAPGRQDALFAYAINLITQGRTTEALAMLKDTVARYPEVAEGHYAIAQALVVIGKDRYSEALPEYEYSLDHKVNLNPPLTLQIYQKFLYYYYHGGDMARLDTVAKRLAVLDPGQKDAFLGLSAYLEKNHSMPILDIQEAK